LNTLRKLRDKFSAMKLRTQLLLTFLLSIFLLFGLSSAFLYTHLLELMKHRNEETTVGSFRQVERSLSDFQMKVDSMSRSFFLNPSFETYLNNTETNPYQRLQLIRSIMDKMADDVSSNAFLHSIFLITEDGRVIGVSASASYVEAEQTPRAFMDSGIHVSAFASYPHLAWTGGVRFSDFEKSVVAMKQPKVDVPIISASRAVKTVYQSAPEGTLVLNIQESAIYNNFRDLMTLQGSQVFLLDSTGIVISSSDKQILGSRRPELTSMQGQYGSFTTDHNKRKEQFIYYRVNETGWVLCMEIPITAFMADINTLRTTILVILVISLVIGVVISFWWTSKLTGPIYSLIAGMRNLKQGHLGTLIDHRPRNELGIMIEEFNRMSRSIHDLVEENNRIERGKKRAEIRVLQSQINPHFLFNTLNTIKWMAIAIRAANIMEIITSLGNLIQPIYKSSVPVVSLREEFAYIHDYLKIMNNRYGEGIRLSNNVDEAFLDVQVPRLIVQPIIENALLHGYEYSNYQGEIIIDSEQSGMDVLLYIRDNGRGIQEEKLVELRLKLDAPLSDEEEEHGNVGLVNVHQRLRLHYGLRYGITIESGDSCTCVMLKLPASVNS
jgi:two-component system sensor histidine kinase YesM